MRAWLGVHREGVSFKCDGVRHYFCRDCHMRMRIEVVGTDDVAGAAYAFDGHRVPAASVMEFDGEGKILDVRRPYRRRRRGEA